jgi:hypothetical protein
MEIAMSVEQNFLWWYSQLFPENQVILCNFLRRWLSPPKPVTEPILPNPPVAEIFFQGYAQLSQVDQQALCNFLRNWLNPHPSQRRIDPPTFSGQFYVAVGEEKMSNSQNIICPHCKREFKLNC